MSDMIKFGSAELPSLVSLADSLRTLSASEEGTRPLVIIKMDKTGHWVYGADLTEIDKDGIWAVNPFSFVKGYIAWGASTVLAEKIVPSWKELTDPGEPPAGAENGWQELIGMSLKCISGEDEGVEARFSTTSRGGRKATAEFAIKVSDRSRVETENFVPLVKLGSGHYQHSQYSRIYFPKYDIVDWTSINGPEQQPEPSDTGRRRRS